MTRYSAFDQLEEAETVVERIAHEVFKEMVAFPSLAKLNHMLSQYNITVGYE